MSKKFTRDETMGKLMTYFLRICLFLGFSGIFVLGIMKWYDLSLLNYQELFSHPRGSNLLLGSFFVLGIPALIIIGRQANAYYNGSGLQMPPRKKIFGVVFAILFLMVGGLFYYLAVPNFPYTNYDTRPYLTWATHQDPSDSITVCWRSETITQTRVEYGTSPNDLSSYAFTSMVLKNHQVMIEGLEANTTYFYRIKGHMDEKIYEFTTAPTGPANFNFIVWGDPRTNDFQSTALNQPRLTDYMHQFLVDEGKSMDFSLNIGDVAFSAFDPYSWQIWLDDVTTHDFASNASHVVATGNHERMLDTRGIEMRKYYPYDSFSFSFRYAQMHVVFLDTWIEEYGWFGNITEHLGMWLEQDLQDNQDADFIILATHPAPIVMGDTSGEWFNGYNFEVIQELADTYGIDAVFYGHRHFYEASLVNETYYFNMGFGGNANEKMAEESANPDITLDILTGETGFCWVEVTPTEMILQPRLINGTELGTFTITA